MRKVLEEIKNIDKSIVKIMNSGFKFSFVVCMIFTYILYLYTLNPISHIHFEIGYLGVKCGLMFFASFLIGAISSNKIFHNLLS